MAITDLTRRQLQIACGSVTAGDDLASIMDAAGGTLKADTRNRIAVAVGQSIGSDTRGDQLCDAIDADGALSAYEVDTLRKIVGGTASVEINAQQG